MKKLLVLAAAAGLLLAIAAGLHAGLIALSTTDGAWALRAATTCVSCHGS